MLPILDYLAVYLSRGAAQTRLARIRETNPDIVRVEGAPCTSHSGSYTSGTGRYSVILGFEYVRYSQGIQHFQLLEHQELSRSQRLELLSHRTNIHIKPFVTPVDI